MNTENAATHHKVRRLSPDDLDGAVAIDREIVGHSRRGYFEKRLAAALRDPDGHMQFAIDGPDGLEAAVLARVQSGEFGREAPAVMLEVIDVAPDQQHLGHGAALLAALEAEMRQRGIAELQTAIAWTDHVMAKFFAAGGFAKAPRHIIAVAVDPARAAMALSDDSDDDDDHDDDDRADNLKALPRDRIDVASLTEQDLDALVVIDSKLTGRDRRPYMMAKLNEALVDSGIRISLAARSDGIVAGFIMARLDFGDFGRTDAVAVIDTIGVHPDFAGHGIAHALLSQLLVNLNGLRVESAETTIALDDFELLGFLYRSGFQPTQRIALAKQTG
jgi:ribosomal protein S18 acetylase RimI-like enzyme